MSQFLHDNNNDKKDGKVLSIPQVFFKNSQPEKVRTEENDSNQHFLLFPQNAFKILNQDHENSKITR